MFHGLAAGWADLVLPGTSYLERDGTYVNLEGRLQRLRRTATPPVPGRARVDRAARRALRRRRSRRTRAAVFAEVSRALLRRPLVRRGRRARAAARLRGRAGARRRARAARAAERRRRGRCRLVAYKPLFSGAAVERVDGAPVPAAAGRGRALARRRRAARHRDRRPGHGRRERQRDHAAARASTGRLRAGIARVALEHADGLGGIVEVAPAEERGDGVTHEPWWIAIIKALDHHQPRARSLRVPDAGRAEG